MAGPEASAAEAPDVDVETVSPALAARFLATLGRPVPVLAAGDPVPIGLHWCLAPDAFANDTFDADGLSSREGAVMRPPSGYALTMWAGAEVRALAPLRIGDVVRRRSRVLDVVERTTRAGPLAFGRVEQVYSVGGEDRIVDVQSYVFRPPGVVVAPGPADAGTVPESEVLRRLVPDRLMLFRFSSITFNPHRIHYDEPYVTGTEGFPGLVVQGTLTATLLAEACARRHGIEAVARMRFRARAPAFAGEALVLVESRTGGGLALAALAGERTVMTAEAGLAAPAGAVSP